MNRKFFQSVIARRLALYIALVSIGLTILSSAFLSYSRYRTEERQVQETIQLFTRSYLPSINHAVWVYNYEQAEVLLKGALGLPYIAGLAIRVNGESVVVEGDPEIPDGLLEVFPLQRLHNETMLQFGTVRMAVNRALLVRRVTGLALALFLQNGLIIFLSAALLLILFHSVVGRHLTALAVDVADSDLDASDERLKALLKDRNVPDEVDNVVLSIIEMRARMRTSMERLADSENHLRLIFDNAPVSIYEEDLSALRQQLDDLEQQGVTDLSAFFRENPGPLRESVKNIRILAVNRKAQELYHAQSKEELLTGLGQTMTEDSLRVFQEGVVALAGGAGFFRSETIIRTLNDQHKPVLLELVIDPSKTDWSRAYVALTDLTEQKATEAALASQQRKYQTLLDNQNDAVFLHKLQDSGFSCFTEVNAVAVQRYGYSRAEFMSMTPVDIDAPGEAERHLRSADRDLLLQQGRSIFEVLHRKKNGEQFPVEVSAALVDLDGEKHILASARDISERKDAQEKYALLLKEADIGIGLADAWTGEILECNQALADMVERTRDELIGQSQTILHPQKPPQLELSAEFISHRDYESGNALQSQCITSSGRVFNVEIKATRFRHFGRDLVLAFFHDITERLQAEAQRLELEKQVRHKFKMEGIGVMAGGIAHNFNNTLSIILGSLEMAQRKLAAPEELRRYIAQARTATLRSRDLVAQILAYSRQSAQEKRVMQLGLVIDETLQLMKSTRPATVEFVYQSSAEADDLAIVGDPGQLQQVLLNLYNNAVHAMDEQGTLNISLDKVFIERKNLPAGTDCNPGDYVRLSVQDNGSGMDERIVERIFDPFFTTKEVNEGTGMGLATVQGIVDQHAGFIQVDTAPGEGSTFQLYFPVVEEQAVPGEALKGEICLTGAERILLIDDEPIMTDLGRQMLEELGYRVTTFNRPQRALARLRQNSGEFDLVLTDLTMPELTGIELAEAIRSLPESPPVILLTGYSVKMSPDLIDERAIAACYQKPLQLAELSHLVRKVLDG